MIQLQGFTQEDFEVFLIPGLEPRMEALIERVRPKLTQFGQAVEPILSSLTEKEMAAHVAKHARRTVHPPDDTWVAWANSKKGYKAHPHFQLGLFATHVFVQFAIIYESTQKAVIARNLRQHAAKIEQLIPAGYFWSTDHTQPAVKLHEQMSKADFQEMVARLEQVKKSELLCGINIPKGDPLLSDGQALLEKVEQTFRTLLPLYEMSF